MNSSPSTYARALTTTPHKDEITVEAAEPEEMEPSGPEYASGYYHGRSSAKMDLRSKAILSTAISVWALGEPSRD